MASFRILLAVALLGSVLLACGGPSAVKENAPPPKRVEIVQRPEGKEEDPTLPGLLFGNPVKNFDQIFTDEHFDEKLPQMRECKVAFGILGTITDARLEKLQGMDKLVSVYLFRSNSDECLTHLKALPNLRSLFLNEASISDAGCKVLSEFPSLESLTFQSSAASNVGMHHLGRIPKLRQLHLHSSRLDDETLKGLAHASHLRFLELRGSMGGRIEITDAGLEAIAKLHNLEELTLENAKIKGPGIRHLRDLRQLKILNLSGSPLTDRAVEHLSAFSGLQSLNLSKSRVSAKGIRQLKSVMGEALITDRSGTNNSRWVEDLAVQPVEDLSRATPEVKITADQLSLDLVRDANGTHQSLRGKVVLVEGEIDYFGASRLFNLRSNLGSISLKPAKEAGSKGVLLRFEMADASPWVTAARGQRVKVMGRFVDRPGFALAKACVFVDFTPIERLKVDARELAVQAGKDLAATTEKYGKTPSIVRGKIASMDFDTFGELSIVLEGKDGLDVHFKLQSGESHRLAEAEEGDTIEVVPLWITFEPNKIYLHGALPR